MSPLIESVINPANGHVVREVRCVDESGIDAAVAMARRSFPAWRDMPADQRSKILWRLADLVEQHHRELGELDTLTTGKVIRDSVPEALKGGKGLRYWAGMCGKILGQELADDVGRFSYTRRDPVGVVAIIIPSNAPTLAFCSRIGPALATGNTVVIKPPANGAASAERIGELALQAGIPEGVLNIAVADGRVGAHLVGHPDVAAVSFTGSVASGRKVGALAAEGFKKVTLELGGKSPIIVFADADLESAALAAVIGLCYNAGQVCAASTRLLVEEKVANKFCEILLRRLAQVKIGDPMDPDTQVGPLASGASFEKVCRLVSDSQMEGAEVLAGGRRPTELADGYYFAPTLVKETVPVSVLDREEVFGPVLSMRTFADEAEALALANDSEYGLSAYLWTTDAGRLHRMAHLIEAGVVHGNITATFDAHLPFGGVKNSGVGGAYAADAVEGCTRTRRVTLRTAPGPLTSPWPGV